jgi:hypothetical protein
MASILRIAAGVAVALALLPAAGSGGATGSGLYGTVRKGPIRPVCRQGVPCDGPVAKTMLVFSKSGREVARVRSTAQGTYRLALRPGYYDVRATVKIGLTKLPKPHAIHVRAGHWDRINLFFDTGIR